MNLLFKSKHYVSYQCDSTRCFYVDFGEKKIRLRFCQLLDLRKKLNAIDISTHFDPDLNPHGLEIVTFCNREHLLILDTQQVLELKEVIKNTFGMLELNALVSHSTSL